MRLWGHLVGGDVVNSLWLVLFFIFFGTDVVNCLKCVLWGHFPDKDRKRQEILLVGGRSILLILLR